MVDMIKKKTSKKAIREFETLKTAAIKLGFVVRDDELVVAGTIFGTNFATTYSLNTHELFFSVRHAIRTQHPERADQVNEARTVAQLLRSM
jgi:hypothetical protein